MSAFLCADSHISTIAAGFCNKTHTKNVRRSNERALMGGFCLRLGFRRLSVEDSMKLANLLSLRARYNDTFGEDDIACSRSPDSADPEQMIDLINCFIYQCSEFSDTDRSPDARFVRYVCELLLTYSDQIAEQTRCA